MQDEQEKSLSLPSSFTLRQKPCTHLEEEC